MKVGLISFHNAYNYGACLQAYALQEAILGFGAECEYIDYINKRRADGYKMSARIAKSLKAKDFKGTVKNICGVPFVRSRGRKFDKFYKSYLRKTGKTYRSCSEAQVLESAYDKFIVGSDQVWNYEHNGTDEAFFLSFVKDDSKKISYSSSFGMESIPEDLKNWYKENLSHITCLSTREQAGVRIIKDLLGRDAHLVLDPVFLVDSEKWNSLTGERKNSKKYSFYYMNAAFNPRDIELVTGWKDNEKHILSSSVSPKDFLKKGQKVTFAMSPKEFLQQINDAELVVTTSFHCLAFSILFHKKFIAVLSGDEGRDERLLNLLSITGLEDRIFSPNMTLEDVNKNIDYDEVERRLKVYREYSLEYLKQAVFQGAAEADALEEPVIEPGKKDEYEICAYDKCSGCGACYMRCPADAISMKADKEGFLRPAVAHEKCIHCGLCREVCPNNHPVEHNVFQKYYAVKGSSELCKKSSSGGAFRSLAYEVIRQGGAVIASEMRSDWTAEHSVAYDAEAVERQGKTYYVQGSAFGRFKETEELLKKDIPVLFVGTPCQISGLRGFLKRDYENLITCDIICHGIPSPLMFRIYTDYLKSKGEITELKQRDKSLGWKGYCVSAVISGKKYRNPAWLKAYGVMFSHGLINRPSCYRCGYASYDRPSDITIGDYWGVEKHHKELVDKLGVSLVIVNSKKGQDLLDRSCSGAKVVSLAKEETAQNSLLHPQKKPLRRLSCITAMQQDYKTAAKKYGEWNFKGSCKETLRNMKLRNQKLR